MSKNGIVIEDWWVFVERVPDQAFNGINTSPIFEDGPRLSQWSMLLWGSATSNIGKWKFWVWMSSHLKLETECKPFDKLKWNYRPDTNQMRNLAQMLDYRYGQNNTDSQLNWLLPRWSILHQIFLASQVFKNKKNIMKEILWVVSIMRKNHKLYGEMGVSSGHTVKMMRFRFWSSMQSSD